MGLLFYAGSCRSSAPSLKRVIEMGAVGPAGLSFQWRRVSGRTRILWIVLFDRDQTQLVAGPPQLQTQFPAADAPPDGVD
jgi:hypothetical protein